MSYQEKKTISNMFFSLLVIAGYSFYVYHYQLAGADPESFSLSFWAKTVLWFMPVAIVARMLLMILFAIFYTIITRNDADHMEDERDKIIELKTSRLSNVLFILGFFLSMGVLAAEMPYYLMFVTVVFFGFIAEQIGLVLQLYYYRKGI